MTNKPKHTPGPLRVYRDGQYDDIEIRDRDGRTVCYLFTPNDSAAQVRATAYRLAACWNACEGINPEAVPLLLEACERLLSVMDAEPEACGVYKAHQEIARAALAKAKGGE